MSWQTGRARSGGAKVAVHLTHSTNVAFCLTAPCICANRTSHTFSRRVQVFVSGATRAERACRRPSTCISASACTHGARIQALSARRRIETPSRTAVALASVPTDCVQARQTRGASRIRLQVVIGRACTAVAALRRRHRRILTSQARVAFASMPFCCCKASCAARTRCSSIRILIRRPSCAVCTHRSGCWCVLSSRAIRACSSVALRRSKPSQARHARCRGIGVMICGAFCA